MKEIKKIVKSVPRTSGSSNPAFIQEGDGSIIIRVCTPNYALRIIEALRSNGYDSNLASQYSGTAVYVR